ITIGFATQALAGWSLSTMDVNLTTGDVLWAIFAQGFGVGILWPPITVVAFSTLPRMQMPEGTAVYHLLRNIGSSVHISLSIAIVLRMSRTSYAELAPSVSAFDELLAMPWVTGAFNLESQAGLAALSGEMARQSAMLGYISSFHFFTWTALAVLPLVFLVRLRR
ncbi:MAG: MFS transporter, partial [Ectothiorhodospiraceae bacterium]|nr:MFS transporter [Ectothiorhodospiraceae bacterium]